MTTHNNTTWRAGLALSGRVRTRSRGLSGASITLTDRAGSQTGLAHTGPDGRFEIAGLPDGTHLAIFSHTGYRPHAAVVSPSASPVSLDVVLEPATSVRGMVSDRHSGRPVSPATVSAIAAGGQVIATTVSNPDGWYAIDGIDTDEITLAVAAPGADPFAAVVHCGNGTDHEVDLALDVYSTLAGTVTDAEKPVAGLPLVLRDHEGLAIATTVTDAQGRYRFDRVRAGDYTVDGAGRPPQARPLTPESVTANLLL